MEVLLTEEVVERVMLSMEDVDGDGGRGGGRGITDGGGGGDGGVIHGGRDSGGCDGVGDGDAGFSTY